MGDTFPRPRSSGNARANITDAPKECNNGGASEFSRVLLKCIPGTKSIMRVPSGDRLKMSERQHLRSSFLNVHYKLSSEYFQKRR